MAILYRDIYADAGCAWPGPNDAGEIEWATDGDLVDLTGYTAALKARAYPDANTAVLELDEGDGITLGGVAGTIEIEISAARTLAMGVGVFPYDLTLTPSGGDTFVFMRGHIHVSQTMARA